MKKLKVLVACECSGKVREAFRALGHYAWSCDIQPADDGSEFHYQGDCWPIIEIGWDLIILHPPCTYIAVCANRWYGNGTPGQGKRAEAVAWTVALFNHAKDHSPKVAMENPVGVLPKDGRLPKPNYVQPFEFGHPESKKTGLWLHNLPPLTSTDNVKHIYDALPKKERNRIHYMSPSEDRGKLRSETYQGLANAFAEQWGTA